MSTPTTEQIPTTYEVLEAMAEADGWYIRKRRRVMPALWRTAKREAFAPATPKDVEEWMLATFPAYAAYSKPDLRRSAEAVIAEAKYHDYGLPVLTDQTMELVS